MRLFQPLPPRTLKVGLGHDDGPMLGFIPASPTEATGCTSPESVWNRHPRVTTYPSISRVSLFGSSLATVPLHLLHCEPATRNPLSAWVPSCVRCRYESRTFAAALSCASDSLDGLPKGTGSFLPLSPIGLSSCSERLSTRVAISKVLE